MAILYQRYSSLLYAFAYRIVADHQVAEDLLQESFLAVWQRASSYSPQLGAVYTWLAAITHHRAIDYVRSRRSYVVFTLGEVKTTGRATLRYCWRIRFSCLQGSGFVLRMRLVFEFANNILIWLYQ